MSGFIDIRAITFFNAAPLMDAVDQAERRTLSKAGAFVRRRAKSSIRKRKGVSKPGQPPSSHEGSLKRLIFFGYSLQTGSVVVGPVSFSSLNNTQSSKTIPGLLEFGGRARRGGRPARYRPRPFMGPAVEAEADNFPALWKNSVR